MPKKKRKTPKLTTSQNPSDQLLEQAKRHIDQFEYDIAQQYCEKALELDANDVRALETLSSICLEVGDAEKAKAVLHHAIDLSPEQGHSKFMSLAQLLGGKEALLYYQKGIDILLSYLDSTAAEASDKHSEIQRDLSNAYCSIAELFTTDLCDDEEAENLCIQNMDKAIATDPTNPDAYLCKANYFAIINNIEEAKGAMDKCLSYWFPHMQAVLEGKADDVDLVEVCPMSYSSRVNAVKLLIELENYDVAVDILEVLLTENDLDVEVWYLSGLLNYLRGAEFKSNARYYLKKAQKINAKIGNGEPEIMMQVESILKEVGPGNSDDEGGTDESDDKENVNIQHDDKGSDILLSSEDESDPMQ